MSETQKTNTVLKWFITATFIVATVIVIAVVVSPKGRVDYRRLAQELNVAAPESRVEIKQPPPGVPVPAQDYIVVKE